MEKHASILYQLHDPGDGPPSTPEQLAAESELCKAEKQQRAEKCNQRHATPVPCIKWPHDNWFCSKPFEMWKKCGKWTRGFLYKSLACNSSPRPCHLDRPCKVKDQSTFILNFKEGCFSLHGENLTLPCWVIHCTLSLLSSEIMRNHCYKAHCEVKCSFPVLSILVLWPTHRDRNRFQRPLYNLMVL